MQNTTNDTAKTAAKNTSSQVHFITRNDLPLSCPLPSASQWSSHPRVFLKLDREGVATCPYCSTVYILQQDN